MFNLKSSISNRSSRAGRRDDLFRCLSHTGFHAQFSQLRHPRPRKPRFETPIRAPNTDFFVKNKATKLLKIQGSVP